MSDADEPVKKGKKDFVHLHLHSDYSLLNSAIQLKPLAAKLNEIGQSACALTDYGNLFGAVSFFNEMKKAGIKPVIGYDAFLASGSRFDRSSMSVGHGRPHYNMVLLAMNQRGFQNLIKLASLAYTEGFHHRPRIDLEILGEYAEGIIGISSLRGGPVSHFLDLGDESSAASWTGRLREMFSENRFFLEVIPPSGSKEAESVRKIADLAEKQAVPLLATNDVHYLEREDAYAYEVAKCIGEGRTLYGDWRKDVDTERHLATAEEMWAKLGKDLPTALYKTLEVAEMCEVDIPQGDDVRQLPKFPIPPELGQMDTDQYFEKVVWESFEERKRTDWEPMIALGLLKNRIEDYEARLKHEIEVIERMGFAGYFLIVWDFIKFAREKSIPVGPGRGSAAGSLTAFCLRITDVDPLQYDLLFERFLNPERISMPDIDIDFCIRGRAEVIDHVVNLYGRRSVCQIITFATLASKAVIKDVGRVLGLTPQEADRIAKLIPPPYRGRNISISEALAKVPELKALIASDQKAKEVVELSLKLENASRHTSVHAAGVVISPKPLDELIPIAVSDKDELTSQYPMGDLEKVGMLKMDFLGLTTLTVINDCLELIRQKLGIEIDWGKIPTNDEKALRLFAEGRTEAIFQFESSGMQEICRKMGPKDLEDLSALNALYRPGPLDGGMIDDFIDRYKGKKKVEYLLPEMEEILGSTFGVPVYQEQIMHLAQKLAGYSLGEADLMRRAMGKKKIEEMNAHRDRFVEGAAANGIERKLAEDIFKRMSKFADYGFNRSHSMAYAILAFRTAYLKAHFPAFFYASVLTHEAQDSEKIYKYTAELKSMGLELLPPDINESDESFTPIDNSVRFGLTAIKGLGASSIRPIIDERSKGKFRSLSDLCKRVPAGNLNRRALESLISSGALDSLNSKGHSVAAWRSMLFSSIETALRAGQRANEDRSRGQSALFRDDDIDQLEEPNTKQVQPWTLSEMAERERAALGFYLSSHPLDGFRELLESQNVIMIVDAIKMPSGSQVSLAGNIGGLQIRTSKQGNRFANFRLEDRSGTIKCAVLGGNFEKLITKLPNSGSHIVEGRIEVSEGQEPSFKVSEIRSIDDVLLSSARRLQIKLPYESINDAAVEGLLSAISGTRGDCALDLIVFDKDLRVRLAVDSMKIRPDIQMKRRIEDLGFEVVAVA
jgi:DNA polymerase-3 subunit alpha